jgi:G3E family GTPase
MTESIPYTVIGGYLGAGKTTLLNNLLRNSQGLRLAVLVNDFGDINIDADLIASHDGETINLASGCICCSLADGFMLALNRVSKRKGEIDHIVVEASGVSDPLRIGHFGAILKLDLEGVIVLVDAEQIREKAANKYVGETVVRQLKGADLLVLNKIDLVTAQQLLDVRNWLAELVPSARIVEADHGEISLSVLLGRINASPHDGARESEQRSDAEVHPEAHNAMYETWSYVSGSPIARQDMHALLDSLPANILRAKGFVHLLEEPHRRCLLQLVGRRWKLSSGEPWGDTTPETRLVFIGLPGTLPKLDVEQRLASLPKFAP